MLLLLLVGCCPHELLSDYDKIQKAKHLMFCIQTFENGWTGDGLNKRKCLSGVDKKICKHTRKVACDNIIYKLGLQVSTLYM